MPATSSAPLIEDAVATQVYYTELATLQKAVLSTNPAEAQRAYDLYLLSTEIGSSNHPYQPMESETIPKRDAMILEMWERCSLREAPKDFEERVRIMYATNTIVAASVHVNEAGIANETSTGEASNCPSASTFQGRPLPSPTISTIPVKVDPADVKSFKEDPSTLLYKQFVTSHILWHVAGFGYSAASVKTYQIFLNDCGHCHEMPQDLTMAVLEKSFIFKD